MIETNDFEFSVENESFEMEIRLNRNAEMELYNFFFGEISSIVEDV